MLRRASVRPRRFLWVACAFLETQTEPQHELWRSLGIVAEFLSNEFIKSRPGVLGAISLRGDEKKKSSDQSKRTQKQRPLRAPVGHAADHAATRRFHRAAFPMSNRASVFVLLAAGRVQARHGRLKRLLAPSAKFRGIHFVPGSEGRPSGDFMGTGFPFPYVTTTHG